jgi:hypothetical protein
MVQMKYKDNTETATEVKNPETHKHVRKGCHKKLSIRPCHVQLHLSA